MTSSDLRSPAAKVAKKQELIVRAWCHGNCKESGKIECALAKFNEVTQITQMSQILFLAESAESAEMRSHGNHGKHRNWVVLR